MYKKLSCNQKLEILGTSNESIVVLISDNLQWYATLKHPIFVTNIDVRNTYLYKEL